MLELYSDIHVKVEAPEKSITFPGPKLATPEIMPLVVELLREAEASGSDAFMITVGGIAWRGQLQNCVDGRWYRLRKTPGKPPTLKSLALPLAAPIEELLLHPKLKLGGIVYVCGGPGQGKTHTASATVVSRLEKFGGVGFTIEDPPEIPLSGWHGDGFCSQSWVDGNRASDWDSAFVRVLRSQPVSTPSILYVGEVRRPETAKAMLRAANNGFLVVSTGFGASLLSGLDAFARLAGEENTDVLGNQLRVVIHQKLGDLLHASVLVSPDANSPVAQRIKNGKLDQLSSDLNLQTNQLRMGQTIWPEH